MGLLDSLDFNKPLLRRPWLSEEVYFSSHPSTAGMMTEDGRVILNPSLKGEENRSSVYRNELARLYMAKSPPNVSLTNEQNAFLDTTSYRDADSNSRASTILARILSGDPSAGNPTFQQSVYVNKLRGLIDGGWR